MKKHLLKSLLALALVLITGNVWGDEYVKVTSAPTDWSGEYLLVYESSSSEGVAWTGVDAVSCNVSVTIANSKISTVPSDAVTLSIASMTGGYSIKINGGTNNGKYIKGTSGSNALGFANEAQLNTLSYESNGVKITSNTSVMRYNNNANNYRFRYFKSSSYTGQQAVQLYKKKSTAPTTEPSITCEETLELPYAEEDGTFDVTWTNVEAMDVILYTDLACTNEFTADWFVAAVKEDGNIEYVSEENTSKISRTVYMQLYALDGEANEITKVVTVSQAAAPLILTSIAVSGTPSKTTYEAGEEFDPTGLVVTGTYDDNTTDDLTDNAEWTFDPKYLSIGDVSVNVTATVNEINSESFTVNGLTVNEAPLKEYLFYESFDTNEGTGGNDGNWSGDIARSDIQSDNLDWTFANEKGANQCAKFGGSNAKGSATTPVINGKGFMILSFKAGAWNGTSEGTTLNISSTSGTLSQPSVTLTKGAWTEYEITITGADHPQITFEAAIKSSNRFFLDEVKVVNNIKVEITSAGCATACAPFNATVTGAKAYYVTVEDDVAKLHEFEGAIPANEGVLLKTEDNAAGTAVFTESAETLDAAEGNLMQGSVEGETFNATGYTYYVLSGGTNGVGFYWDPNTNDEGASAICPAGKAILAVPGSSSSTVIRFGDATLIENVNVVEAGKYFDLMGREVLNPAGGIYILNGKKVLVK